MYESFRRPDYSDTRDSHPAYTNLLFKCTNIAVYKINTIPYIN